MKTPMILPWIAHRAGISEKRAEELWRQALCHATDKTGWVGTSEYWDVAQERLLKLVEREKRAAGCAPPLRFASVVRLCSRLAHLPLLAAEGWSVAWARQLKG
jgi:hypothetical protein